MLKIGLYVKLFDNPNKKNIFHFSEIYINNKIIFIQLII